MFTFNQPSILIFDTTPVQSAIWSAITNMRCRVVNRLTDPSLSTIDTNAVRVILIDDHFNDGNGFTAISSIRTRFKKALIVATSGNPDASMLAYVSGADLFFEKPFDWEKMNDCIRQSLDTKSVRRDHAAA